MDDMQGRTEHERLSNIEALYVWGGLYFAFLVFCLGAYWLGKLVGWWA